MDHVFRVSCLIALLVGCALAKAEDKPSKAFDDSVHMIELTYPEVKTTSGPHQDVFLANCVSCHTLRYITMQPNLPDKKWADEVTKMVKVFGAPIAEEQAQLIVKYLVATNGGKK